MTDLRSTPLSAADTLDADGAPRPGDSYVQSFARGLAVLRSFGAQAPQQTLSEVAERAQLTRAGARRILLTLLHLGYVEADGRLFRLTPKVLDLGYAYLSSLPVWTQAQPLLEELMQTLRQSCSATVLDGDDIVYVVRLSAHRTMSINLGIGSRLPAYCTSMGRVLLAGLAPEALRERLSTMALLKITPATKVDIDVLMEEIAQVRRQGWCLVQEELEQGKERYRILLEQSQDIFFDVDTEKRQFRCSPNFLLKFGREATPLFNDNGRPINRHIVHPDDLPARSGLTRFRDRAPESGRGPAPPGAGPLPAFLRSRHRAAPGPAKPGPAARTAR